MCSCCNCILECMLSEQFRSKFNIAGSCAKQSLCKLAEESGARWLLMRACMWGLGLQTPGGLAVRQSL